MPERRQKLPCPIAERATPFVTAGNGDPGGQRPGVLEVRRVALENGCRVIRIIVAAGEHDLRP